MRIDQMREQDIDAITKLEQQLFPQAPWTWDGFRQELDKPTSVCLCLLIMNKWLAMPFWGLL